MELSLLEVGMADPAGAAKVKGLPRATIISMTVASPDRVLKA